MNKRQLHKMICDNIEESQPPQRQANRNGLKKYLSQEMTYEGVIEEVHKEHFITLLKQVCGYGKNKILADHVWLGQKIKLPIGTRIKFEGVATNYTDGKGVRKYKIKSIRNIEEI